MHDNILLFQVVKTERTRVDADDVLGWGVRFPSGACHVDWNLEAFPREDRLNHPHISQYGCLDDVEQGTGGEVQRIYETPAEGRF